jgi:hypothetical protein
MIAPISTSSLSLRSEKHLVPSSCIGQLKAFDLGCSHQSVPSLAKAAMRCSPSRFLMATLYLLIGAAERGSNAVLLFMKLLIHRLTTAKNSPVESPHMRMPVNAAIKAKNGVESGPRSLYNQPTVAGVVSRD